MKKLSIVMLMTVLVVVQVFSGCAESAPTEVIELKLTTHVAPMSTQVQLYEEWADKIEEATNGEVKITVYSASTLLGVDDVLPGVKSGIAEIGELVLGIYPDQFPLNNILSLPFMSLGDTETACKVWTELEDEFPEMNTETKDVKILFLTAFSPFSFTLHTTKAPARVPEDINGLKMLATGPVVGEMMENAGAAPMTLPVTDWYMSLEKGLIEGMFMVWKGIWDTECYKLLQYHTIFPSTGSFGSGLMIMNLDTWNKLSPDAQKAFDDLSDWMSERYGKIMDEADATIITQLQEEGHTVVTITPDEEKLWIDTALSIHEAELAKLDDQGLPATEIYERALELAEQYSK